MSPAMNTLFFEDFKPGHLGRFGPQHVTAEEIRAFASEFDPQPMHLDEEAASRSLLKGLAGSGWHLCSITMRMMFDGFIGRTASLGSPGVNELIIPNYKQTWAAIRKLSDAPEGIRQLSFKSLEYNVG